MAVLIDFWLSRAASETCFFFFTFIYLLFSLYLHSDGKEKNIDFENPCPSSLDAPYAFQMLISFFSFFLKAETPKFNRNNQMQLSVAAYDLECSRSHI